MTDRSAAVSEGKLSQQQRQDYVAELIFQRGVVRVDDLIDLVDVSPMTLYRDLATLESRQVIYRSRGEVSAVATSMSETAVGFRRYQEPEAKGAVARLAAAQLEPYHTLFFDDSTTVLAIAEHLTETQQKTLITNSLTVANEVDDLKLADLIMLGGHHRRQLDAFFGPLAHDAISRLYPNVAVFGGAAIQDNVLFHPYSDVAAFKTAVMERSEVSILVVTSSKFNRTSLYRMADIADFDLVITDRATPPEAVDRLREVTRVIVA